MRIRVAIFVCIFLLNALIVDAQGFGVIKTVPAAGRVSEAVAIYKHLYRHVDSATAFRNLGQLGDIAKALEDKPLGYAVFDCKADYYSVNFGFNPHSLFYYQKAIDQSIADDLAAETGIYIFKKGLYYYTFKMYAPACQNFYKAYDIFKKVGPENVPGIARDLGSIAALYYELGDLETSKRFLLEALSYHTAPAHDEINMINTVGLIYRSTNEYNMALQYFNKAAQLAKKSKDSVWMAIARGNIGSIYFMQKNYDLALPYLKTDYEQSVNFGEKVNGAIALIRIATINTERKNYEEALSQLLVVEDIIKHSKQELTLKQRIDMYALRADIFEHMHKADDALFYRKKYERALDSLTKRNDILAIARISLKWETDNEKLKVNELNIKAHDEKITRNMLAGVLFLLIIISFLIYNRQKLVIKKDKAIFEKQQVALQLETSRADEESNKTRLALVEYTNELRVKNDTIESFKAELDNMQKQTDPLYQQRVGQLEEMMNAHIMTDKAWLEFKTLFEKVHHSFFTILTSRFNDITEADMRLLSLIRLKLNNREMAGMLGITIEGVKKAKQRLRKKTGLPEENSLETVIAEI